MVVLTKIYRCNWDLNLTQNQYSLSHFSTICNFVTIDNILWDALSYF